MISRQSRADTALRNAILEWIKSESRYYDFDMIGKDHVLDSMEQDISEIVRDAIQERKDRGE